MSAMRFSKAQKWRSKYFPRKKAKKPRGDTTTWHNGVEIISEVGWNTLAIKTVSWILPSLKYKPQILDVKIEELVGPYKKGVEKKYKPLVIMEQVRYLL